MNQPSIIAGPVLRRLAGFALLLVSCHPAAAAPAAEAPKPYRLFMGSNLAIVGKDLPMPVSDVRNNAFVVKGPRGELLVDPEDHTVRLKIDDALKLTSTLATIDGLKFEPAYTAANDPMERFAANARVGAYLADVADMTARAQNISEAGVGMASAAVTASAGTPLEGAARASLASAQSQLNNAQAAASRAQLMTQMDAVSVVSSSNRLTNDIAAEQFDAIHVTFKISAPQRLDSPYAVIFMRFLADKNEPKSARVWIYAEKLPDIDEHPRTITVRRGGFPPGYHIDSYQMRLYAGTREIATTVSPKQVALTTDEAFQYTVIQHITSNRNETKGPVKAAAFWPDDLHTRLNPERLSRTLFVKVAKDGRPLGMFEDESCAKPVADTELAAVTSELRFFPALEKGKPTEGVASVRLGRSQ